MSETVPRLADLELHPDVVSAVAALQSAADGGSGPSLPEWAVSSGVTVIGGVTLIRPDDAAIRDEGLLTRPGLRYCDLVRHHRHCRLVIDFGRLGPFGHPFHDDIFALLRELGRVGGRLAVCGAKTWYTDRLPMYHPHLRVVVGLSAGVLDGGSQHAEPSAAPDPAT